MTAIKKTQISEVVVCIQNEDVRDDEASELFEVVLDLCPVLARGIYHLKITVGLPVFCAQHAHRRQKRDAPPGVSIEALQ